MGGILFISEAAVASPTKTIASGFFCTLMFISITMPIFYKFTKRFVFAAFVRYVSRMEDITLLLSIMAIAAGCYALSWK
ncbi:hypothetical protein [Planococcus maritimus]|uniref:hypothetical protein n=1 Tax=Planococcus maritimus TaxID=192421 RepID=UPI003139A481